MSDPRNILQSMYGDQHRYDCFGNVLTEIQAEGFRCHSKTTIDIRSPVTALSGLNGTGKSTILQLAAVAYANEQGSSYYIKDFLVVGALDPTPFLDHANVRFRYWKSDRSLQTLTISRNLGTGRWTGYKRRPKRRVVLVGASPYLARKESRDFVVRYAPTLTLETSSLAIGSSCIWPSRILHRHYDEVRSNVVSYGHKTGKITSVQRAGVSYSEAHMGCGEGRTHWMVDLLESAPERSLFLLEEPEASLHPSAEHELGKYLVDVSIRRGHQIIITTHSEYILESLPQASRMYLELSSSGLRVSSGLTARQAKSLLTEGHFKALIVLVEDECAKAIVTELVRRIDPQYLQTIDIYPGGDADAVAHTVRSLKESQVPLAAVRDGDKPAIPSENIFKLPGNEPPEKEMFKHPAMKTHISSTYGISLDDFAASVSGTDHHRWIAELARRANMDAGVLLGEMARVYSHSIPEPEATSLTSLLKEASQ